MDNQTIIWNYFKDKGLNDYAIAGLMGNLRAESNLNPINLQNTYNTKFGYTDEEYTYNVDCGNYSNFIFDKAGYGLAQWTYWSRKQNLWYFAKEQNKSIGDINMQLDFLYKELTTGYKGVWNTLLNATSVREASDVVLLKFEKPADQSVKIQEKRATYGQEYYDKFHNDVEIIETKNEKVEQSNVVARNQLKVHLDPGHYGTKYNRSPVYPSYYESNFNWKLATYLREELENVGVEVSLSRNTINENPSLYNRGYGAKGCDLFLSLHSNACDTESVDRVVCFRGYDKEKATEFGQELVNLVTSLMGSKNKPKVNTRLNSKGNNEYYGVLRGARAAGLDYYYIIEHGFHTNLENAKWLYKEDNIKLLAKKECALICSYFGFKKDENNKMDTNTYVVQKGDTLNKISSQLNVSVDDLVEWNNIKNKNLIVVGQKLIIKKEVENVVEEIKTYVVQENDTISSIAQKFNISVDTLVKLNGLITVGQEIKIK